MTTRRDVLALAALGMAAGAVRPAKAAIRQTLSGGISSAAFLKT